MVELGGYMKEVKFIKWVNEFDYDDDEVYKFRSIGATGDTNKTEVTIDWLNMDLSEAGLIVREQCSCKTYKHRRKRCKHITAAIEEMYSCGIKFRSEDNLKRYWCPICHKDSDAQERKKVMCYNCQVEMRKSDNSPLEKINNEQKTNDNRGTEEPKTN